MYTETLSVRAALPALMFEKEVCDWLGLTRQSLATMVKTGVFPAPIRIGLRRKAWPEAEIGAWFESRRGCAPTRRNGS